MRSQKLISKISKGVSLANSVWRERHKIREILRSPNYRFLQFSLPGHFYSPIPDIDDIRANSRTIFDRSPTELPGINARAQEQIDLARDFVEFYQQMPFPEKQQSDRRYYLDNSYFSYGDGVVLYSMMRRFRPKRIIEVGSGFSSAAMLDVDDHFYGRDIDFTFIEPYPQRLRALLRETDAARCQILEMPVQQVAAGVFATLKANDYLFIDSSHVAKTHSDVVHLLFNVLPSLDVGVIVHFHDILWPFEYPSLWLDHGRAWNEAYFVRAFLQYNDSFEILYFNSMMETKHGPFLQSHMSLVMKAPSSAVTPGNTSLWIRKIR